MTPDAVRSWFDCTDVQAAEVLKYWALARERSSYFAVNHGRNLPDAFDHYRPEGIAHPRMLEVGGGSFAFAAMCRDRGWRAFGVDVVPQLSQIANVLCAPAWELPYRDHWFDAVACFDCLEHLREEDVPAAIREMVRVLTPTGYFYGTVSHAVSGSRGVQGEILHPTVRPPEWWLDQFRPYFAHIRTTPKGKLFVAHRQEVAACVS